MVLTQAVVDEFLGAEKSVVSRTAEMQWRSIGVDHLRWSARVDVQGVERGVVLLVFNRSLPCAWNLSLRLIDEEVCLWHFKNPVKHRNRGCPSDFPRRVKGPHEHTWVEGHGVLCATPIDAELASGSHADVVAAFCARVNLRLTVSYQAPQFGEQLVLDPEEAEQ